MRTALVALALILAACSPPTPPQDSAANAGDSTAAPQNPDAAALSANPAAGQWFEQADEGTFAAGFGEPNSEYQFTVVCTSPSGAITLRSSHELSPDQRTTMRLITATQSLELPADSFNEGLPSIDAQLADADPLKPLLIGMLGAPTDRFAVDAGGQITVFPWHESIARTLIACR